MYKSLYIATFDGCDGLIEVATFFDRASGESFVAELCDEVQANVYQLREQPLVDDYGYYCTPRELYAQWN